MRRLTLQTLIHKGACEEQVSLFRALFGEEMEVTEELCGALAEKFYSDWDWTWFGENLLSTSSWRECVRVWVLLGRDYSRATTPLWEEYYRAKDLFWEEYYRAKDLLRGEYKGKCNRSQAHIQEELLRAIAPLRKEHARSTARLWAKLYIQDV